MPRPAISEPLLIVCEGSNDEDVFRCVLNARGVAGFQVESPTSEHDGAWGLSAFTSYLDMLAVREGIDSVSGVMVVADCDIAPERRMQEVRRLIAASRRYRPPDAARQLVKSANVPPLAVFLLPWDDEPGCLESMVLPAIAGAYSHISGSCLPSFETCTGCDQWDIVKRSKMQVRALLAAGWKKDPCISLGTFFKKSGTPVTGLETCFDRFAQWCLEFSAQCGAGASAAV